MYFWMTDSRVTLGLVMAMSASGAGRDPYQPGTARVDTGKPFLLGMAQQRYLRRMVRQIPSPKTTWDGGGPLLGRATPPTRSRGRIASPSRCTCGSGWEPWAALQVPGGGGCTRAGQRTVPQWPRQGRSRFGIRDGASETPFPSPGGTNLLLNSGVVSDFRPSEKCWVKNFCLPNLEKIPFGDFVGKKIVKKCRNFDLGGGTPGTPPCADLVWSVQSAEQKTTTTKTTPNQKTQNQKAKGGWGHWTCHCHVCKGLWLERGLPVMPQEH